MPKLITKREKTILSITIIVIVASTLYNFVLAPIFTELDIANRDIIKTKGRIKKYTRLLAQKDALEARHQDLIFQIKNYGHIQKDVLGNTLAGLESLAQEANIRIVDIRPQNTSFKGARKDALVELKSEGTMESFIKFIYNIENSILLLRIKKFQLTAKANAQHLEGVFTISVPLVLD